MITRRRVLALTSLAVAGPRTLWGQNRGTQMFLDALGPLLTLYRLNPQSAELIRTGSITLPSDVQYVWPHPTQPVVYVASSALRSTVPSGEPAAQLTAIRVDAAVGTLMRHGPDVALPSRANHLTVDHTGSFILVSHPNPASRIYVYRIRADLSVGAEVLQPDLDVGIYAHQVRMTPSNTGVIVVSRGNNATATTHEDPGSLHSFRFKNGRLTPLSTVAPNGGYGFGPRHLDFHPTQPWVYVSLERQNLLHVYRLRDDRLDPAPVFLRPLLEHPERVAAGQLAGTVHAHPNGRVIYCANRGDPGNSDEHGENNLAVFAIDARTGLPTRVQTVDTHGFHPRTFSLNADGTVLVVGHITSHTANVDHSTMPTTLAVFRVRSDGTLEFVRDYRIDESEKRLQFWSGFI